MTLVLRTESHGSIEAGFYEAALKKMLQTGQRIISEADVELDPEQFGHFILYLANGGFIGLTQAEEELKILSRERVSSGGIILP